MGLCCGDCAGAQACLQGNWLLSALGSLQPQTPDTANYRMNLAIQLHTQASVCHRIPAILSKSAVAPTWLILATLASTVRSSASCELYRDWHKARKAHRPMAAKATDCTFWDAPSAVSEVRRTNPEDVVNYYGKTSLHMVIQFVYATTTSRTQY
ncbi:hypothetical protein Anapl_04191 [Anas platyrhynchos]|uniref:Uncharacterized protein n=1 Tax=Anas platyrhynchos TaxID=8839 RepID=R0LF79_ANAPL|nr:hypothetical protein Anapl_04191 [Anas platyrhynchos]